MRKRRTRPAAATRSVTISTGASGQRVGVELAVALVEARGAALDREVTLRPRDGQLEALVAIAQVGQARDPARVGGTASAASHGLRLALQLERTTAADGGEVVVGRLLQIRARVVVAHLGAEQAERGEHAGVARHHDRRACRGARRGRRRAAGRRRRRHQREVARVVAALDRHQRGARRPCCCSRCRGCRCAAASRRRPSGRATRSSMARRARSTSRRSRRPAGAPGCGRAPGGRR